MVRINQVTEEFNSKIITGFEETAEHRFWKPNDSYNLRNYIEPFKDTALIMPSGLCKQKSLLTIFVASRVDGFQTRKVIRETWGNTSRFNYPEFNKMHGHLKGLYYPLLESRLVLYAEHLRRKNYSLFAMVEIVFIVGRSTSPNPDFILRQLQQEADHYNDIIQEDFLDTYYNLTLKSVLALKHVNNKCFNSSAYFLKTDDDCFVNVPNLIHILLGGTIPAYKSHRKKQDRLTATRGVLMGHAFNKNKPIRYCCTKFYVPKYIYPGSMFPKYLSGSGYLMSIDVVRRLYEAAWSTRMIHIEDLFVTGLCSLAAEVNPVKSPLFILNNSHKTCFIKGSVVQHDVGISRIKNVFNRFTNNKTICPIKSSVPIV
nr:beta-1,3-galactosyltransferase 1-like [Drosophila bipectinata]